MAHTERVYYHHPDNKHLSLDFLHPNCERVRQEMSQSDSEITEICEYNLGTPVYVLYTGDEPPGPADEIDLNPTEMVEWMSEADRQITTNLLQAFVKIIEEKEEQESEKLRAYKNMDVDGIPDALSRVGWEGTVAEVGGRLMSNLILKHSFPNANHRSSLVLLERYIRSHEHNFSMPRMHTEDYDWRNWADDYICESKRLLTIRRNAPRFYYLWKFGCRYLMRKGGIRIDLDQYELTNDINEAHQYYAAKHEQLCQELAIEIIKRQEYDNLIDKEGMSKHQFARRLEQLP